MLRFLCKDQKKFYTLEDFDTLKVEDIIWIDMCLPTADEVSFIENRFNTSFPTKQKSQEIEISSRYWEKDEKIEINSYFLIPNEQKPKNETVSFILKGTLLLSLRYVELSTFKEAQKRYFASTALFHSGYDILSAILDIRIDADADIIEELSRDITKIRRIIFSDIKNKDEEILEVISAHEDLNMKIRESLTDKQRILVSLLKSTLCKNKFKKEIQIMIKDTRSLIEYTQFNFERIEYLQNIFLGALSVEQNKVIKIFTIVNVIFLPPTLIASIYGMNFTLMPELSWKYGYIFSILLMIVSAITPIYIFKKKGWV